MRSREQSYYFDRPPTSGENFFHEHTKLLPEMPDDGPLYVIAMVPIRLLIFVLTLTLLVLLIYLTSHRLSELQGPMAYTIVGLTITFLFFSVIHVIGHFGNTEIVVIPMVVGSLIGALCFLFMGTYIIRAGATRSYARIMAFIVSFIIGFLHAVDILLIIGHWRHKYRRKLVLMKLIHPIFDPHTCNQTFSSSIEVDKRDIQTSMASIETILDPYEDRFYRTHRMKRNDAPSSKSYAEYPSPGEYSTIASRGIQSNYSLIQREVQATRIGVKEKPVQTASRCGLCDRYIDLKPHSPRQYNTSIFEASSRDPTVATSPHKSVPVQTVPTHSTPSSSPTRISLICLCKHRANNVLPLNVTTRPIEEQFCGSCKCLSLTIAKLLTIHHQHQHQHQSPPQPQPRQIVNELTSNHQFDTTGTNPIFDKRPSSSHTKPVSERLAAVTKYSAASSSSLLHVHKNKRTQTKGENVKKQSSPEKENEVIRYRNRGNCEEIDEKFIEKKIEIHSIDLNSSHRVMPRYESTPKKGINVKSHGPPSARKVIGAKEKKIDEELKLTPDFLTKEKNNSGEVSLIESNLNSSKTRTKTLYREVPKLTHIESEEKNKILLKSDKNLSDIDQKVLDGLVSSPVKKENRTNMTASPNIGEAALIRPSENIADKDEISEEKEKLKNVRPDEVINGTRWRPQSRTSSGSTLYRPRKLSKNTL